MLSYQGSRKKKSRSENSSLVEEKIEWVWLNGLWEKNMMKSWEKVKATALTSGVDSLGLVCEWSTTKSYKSYWYWVSIKENGDKGVEKLSLRTTWLAIDYSQILLKYKILSISNLPFFI